MTIWFTRLPHRSPVHPDRLGRSRLLRFNCLISSHWPRTGKEISPIKLRRPLHKYNRLKHWTSQKFNWKHAIMLAWSPSGSETKAISAILISSYLARRADWVEHRSWRYQSKRTRVDKPWVWLKASSNNRWVHFFGTHRKTESRMKTWSKLCLYEFHRFCLTLKWWTK